MSDRIFGWGVTARRATKVTINRLLIPTPSSTKILIKLLCEKRRRRAGGLKLSLRRRRGRREWGRQCVLRVLGVRGMADTSQWASSCASHIRRFHLTFGKRTPRYNVLSVPRSGYVRVMNDGTTNALCDNVKYIDWCRPNSKPSICIGGRTPDLTELSLVHCTDCLLSTRERAGCSVSI